ncbi:hypothetical protein KQI84_05150 [bacterium]|nr:hypothetical protein [bacterium]
MAVPVFQRATTLLALAILVAITSCAGRMDVAGRYVCVEDPGQTLLLYSSGDFIHSFTRNGKLVNRLGREYKIDGDRIVLRGFAAPDVHDLAYRWESYNVVFKGGVIYIPYTLEMPGGDSLHRFERAGPLTTGDKKLLQQLKSPGGS